jgi:hypothetical protein
MTSPTPPRSFGSEDELVEQLLRRTEQLALDGIHAGNRSASDAAIARTVVLWAAMTIRSLAQETGSTSTANVEHRLGSLVAIAQGGQTDPLSLADPAVLAARTPKGIPHLVVVYLQIDMHQDVAHSSSRRQPFDQVGVEPERLAQNRKDAPVVVGHPQAQLRDQMSANVNADLNRELDRMLRGKSIAKSRVVGRTAPGPDPLRLRKQLGEMLKPGVDAFRVDQSDPL